MAEKLVTPVDEMTGLPYSIILNESISSLHRTSAANRNHAFHPKMDPRLKTVGGQALRVCRIQIVEATQHNLGEHCYHSYYDGPPIIEDEMEQFRTVIWALAGYIPERGIQLNGGEPVERQITNNEMDLLKTTSVNDYKYIHFGGSALRVFMRKVILDKSMQVDLSKLDSFLSSKSLQKRRRLGMEVLKQASAIASLEISSEYKVVHSAKMLRPEAPDSPAVLIDDVIRNPVKVERRMFGQLTQIAERVLENAA